MQPSQSAIEREFEALRDIRRRSSSQGGPGALILDPDLPAQLSPSASPLSPQAWTDSAESKTSPTRGRDDSSSSTEDGNAPADDPFHLFWVPAHLHPELAPSEFRAFLKEHARAPADGAATATLSRSGSASSTASLGRKRSMLSRQYRPRENDGVEEERVVPLRRNKSIYSNDGPQLTISDLQKFEELADEASKSDDPTKLRRVIRRSLSLNVAPSFLDQMDDVPDIGDDADVPIIIPQPNQALRRSNRTTRVRKPGEAGERRHPASRRKSGGRAATIDVPARSPSDGSSSGHGDTEAFRIPPLPSHKVEEEADELQDNRRMTYTEESLIYDAYADSPDEKEPSPRHSGSPPPLPTVVQQPVTPPLVPSAPEPSPAPSIQQPPLTQPQSILYQPQPQRHLSPTTSLSPTQVPSRTPSPDASSVSFDEHRRPDSRGSMSSEATYLSTSTIEKRKEKEKKSIWKKVGGGGDKGSKKGGEEKGRGKEREKEKEGGFFGSFLFGGKKKQEDHAPTNLGGGAGPATAVALLGASKSSKPYQPSLSPQLGNPFARYPIHVERAVYRLSHIKLANPRRPLYEQVLISNLMFWYLGVINKTQQSPGQNQGQQATVQTATTPGAQVQSPDTSQITLVPQAMTPLEKEQSEEQERTERERMEWEREQKERERAEPKRESRRGSLTKTPPSGPSASAGRRAEMPVKGPQYSLQSQVIEQEYGHGLNSVPMSRASSSPSSGNATSPPGFNGGYSNRPYMQQPKQSSPTSGSTMYSQPDGNQNYYYGRSGSMELAGSLPPRSTSPVRNSTPALPPGAMAPLSTNEQLWIASLPPSSPTSRTPSSPQSYSPNQDSSRNAHPPRPARSPPPNNHSHSHKHDWSRSSEWDGTGNGKIPTRSLSANAIAPQVSSSYSTGGLKKKVASVNATTPDRRPRTSEGGEEEDVPLAVWQQQRRK